MNEKLEPIFREADEIEGNAAIMAQAHFLNGRKWQKRHLWFGIPATALAAVAGVSAFNNGPSWITGGVAVVGAVLSGLSTFLNPSEQHKAHQTACVTYSDIRREASLLKDVEIALVSDDNDKAVAQQFNEKLRELSKKVSDADHNSPAVSVSSWNEAEAMVAAKNALTLRFDQEKQKVGILLIILLTVMVVGGIILIFHIGTPGYTGFLYLVYVVGAMVLAAGVLVLQGVELVRKLKPYQEKQKEQFQALRAAVYGSITKYEHEKLVGLSKKGSFLCYYTDSMIDELKHLKMINFINNRDGTGLAKMKREYRGKNQEFDLKQFFYITKEGQQYLKIRSDTDNDDL